jgi:HipA-like protein
MRKATVYRNNEAVGELTQNDKTSYTFSYFNVWFKDSDKPAVSLTLPKTQQVYQSDVLFPFFFNLLSEGVNRQLQARQLKIDEKDYFGLLLATAGVDTVGAVSVKPNTERT